MTSSLLIDTPQPRTLTTDAASLRNAERALEKLLEPASLRQQVIRRVAIGGVELTIADIEGSYAAGWVGNELHHDEYGIDTIRFSSGDVVVDVGAHVGMFSIYLAKRHPDIRIIAFEPDPINFANLCENLVRNGVENVIAVNMAVTRDGRSVPISVPPLNSGASGGYHIRTGGHRRTEARSMTLEQVFAEYGIVSCRLLKMDCEGAEHEILTPTRVLDRVQWFSAEFHNNETLRGMGYSTADLIDVVSAQIDPNRIAIHVTELHD